MKKSDLNHEQIAEFFAEFYTLRQAGLTEQAALQLMMEEQENSNLLDFLTTLKTTSLIEGLKKFSFIPDYITALLTKASKNNTEIQALADIADHLNKNINTDTNYKRQELISYALYPIVLLTIAMLLLSIISTFIMPAFVDLLYALNKDLPMLTEFFINIGSYALPTMTLLVVIIIALTIYLNCCYGQLLKAKLLLSLPIIGKFNTDSETIAIINIAYLLCQHEFTLKEALHLSASNTKNVFIKNTLTNYTELKQIRIFSTKIIRLLNEFEKTQQISIIKNIIHYQKNPNQQISLSLRLLNIVLFIICYLVVGMMIIALYLPIFQLSTALS